ncbi:MAG: hypothetical protein ACRCZ6_00160 [Kluyvera sp.]|uniref:hypothetical protein n=1 Tax=Kluyvera sp. TaxID=1538228 RepID=UPI003F3D55E4
MNERFSGILTGLEREQKKVSDSDRSTHQESPQSSKHQRRRIPSHNVSPGEDCDTCERSRLVDYLESEVKELTAYAAKAEEAKDSLRRLEDLRKHLAYLIFGIIGLWLVAVFGLVFLGSLDVYYFQGDCKLADDSLFFHSSQVMSSTCAFIKRGSVLNLSEKIVIALITTTTINILGLAYIVARWLYPDPNGQKKKKQANNKKK